MVEALLCDIDGTLVQSNWLHAEAWQIALGAMGVHLELEELRRQIGKGGDELIPVFVPWWKRDAVAEPLKAFRKHIFQKDFRHRVEPLPGARQFLERVHAAGIKIELASSSDKDDLEIFKDLVPMGDLVDKQTSAKDTERTKPHPDIFVVALRKLGLKPAECIALGDTPYDAESAGKSGRADDWRNDRRVESRGVDGGGVRGGLRERR